MWCSYLSEQTSETQKICFSHANLSVKNTTSMFIKKNIVFCTKNVPYFCCHFHTSYIWTNRQHLDVNITRTKVQSWWTSWSFLVALRTVSELANVSVIVTHVLVCPDGGAKCLSVHRLARRKTLWQVTDDSAGSFGKNYVCAAVIRVTT